MVVEGASRDAEASVAAKLGKTGQHAQALRRHGQRAWKARRGGCRSTFIRFRVIPRDRRH